VRYTIDVFGIVFVIACVVCAINGVVEWPVAILVMLSRWQLTWTWGR
jgi:hypothetical protein